jgi:hypothetical protein
VLHSTCFVMFSNLRFMVQMNYVYDLSPHFAHIVQSK